MTRVWKTSDGGDFTCASCGAIYSVTYQRFPMRDSDNAICEVCGKEMSSWNSTEVPMYRLKPRPEEDKPAK